MNEKIKGIIIDFIILGIYSFILMFGIYILYDRFPHISRLVATLILLVNMPICWGIIILSFMGKRTIGHRLAKKGKK